MPSEDLIARLAATFATGPGVNGASGQALPDRAAAAAVCDALIEALFPGYHTGEPAVAGDLPSSLRPRIAALEAALQRPVAQAADFARGVGRPCAPARELIGEALEALPAVRALVVSDVEAAFASDPAADARETVVLSYPSIAALAVQRFAHRLYRLGVPAIPRMLTEIVHGRTGIDIHPGASIGHSCFIDHGTGVVVGETARIGAHCVLYQGVGLVAWNPLAKDEHGELQRGQSNKRHPDLEDHVTIYAGATILGGDTVIGHHSVIGGSVWLTHSVEPYSVVRDSDPQLVIRKRRGLPPSGSPGVRESGSPEVRKSGGHDGDRQDMERTKARPHPESRLPDPRTPGLPDQGP